MPLYVAGSQCASWGAKYYHRLGQPPHQNHSFRLPCKRSMLVEYVRQKTQRSSPGTATRRNNNSPPQQVRPWVCCMLRDAANVETIPHVRLATSELLSLALAKRKQSTVPLARLSREARSPKAVIPQPNNSASNAQRDSPGSAAVSLQRAHFRQRRFSVQSTLLCLNNSCPLRSATSLVKLGPVQPHAPAPSKCSEPIKGHSVQFNRNKAPECPEPLPATRLPIERAYLSAQAWRSEVLKHIALQPCTSHSAFNILKPLSACWREVTTATAWCTQPAHGHPWVARGRPAVGQQTPVPSCGTE